MAGRKVDEEFGDVPDLALPTPAPPARPPPKPPPPKPRAPQQATAGPGATIGPGGGGRELDDDDPFGMGGGGGSIELDVAPTPHSMRAVPALSSRSSGTMAAVVPPHPSVPSMRPPHVSVPPRPMIAPAASLRPPMPQPGAPLGPDEVDPYDARALADFGEPPAGLLTAPLYALRVKTRQAELRRALGSRRLEAERAQAKLEEALVGFGERARAILQSKPGHHRMLEDVIAAEQLALERGGKLAGEMNAHRARAAAVDARILELETARVRALEEERKAHEAVVRIEADRARAEARIKRREIEARNEAAGRNPRTP